MKFLTVLLSAVVLSSCVHTAVSPVANPHGIPVVIRVPGARVGEEVSKERVMAIDQKVEKEFTGKGDQSQPDPGIVAIGTVGVVGDVKTKRGEKFVGYMPLIVLRSVYEPEQVDRAAARIAAAYYRAAKKHYRLIPITEIESKPQASRQ